MKNRKAIEFMHSIILTWRVQVVRAKLSQNLRDWIFRYYQVQESLADYEKWIIELWSIVNSGAHLVTRFLKALIHYCLIFSEFFSYVLFLKSWNQKKNNSIKTDAYCPWKVRITISPHYKEFTFQMISVDFLQSGLSLMWSFCRVDFL